MVREAGEPYHEPLPWPTTARTGNDRNDTETIRVLDVVGPYTVLDDLSYLRHKGVTFSKGGVSKVDAAAKGADTVQGPVTSVLGDIGGVSASSER
jgi:hypothetical protein